MEWSTQPPNVLGYVHRTPCARHHTHCILLCVHTQPSQPATLQPTIPSPRQQTGNNAAGPCCRVECRSNVVTLISPCRPQRAAQDPVTCTYIRAHARTNHNNTHHTPCWTLYTVQRSWGCGPAYNTLGVCVCSLLRVLWTAWMPWPGCRTGGSQAPGTRPPLQTPKTLLDPQAGGGRPQ